MVQQDLRRRRGRRQGRALHAESSESVSRGVESEIRLGAPELVDIHVAADAGNGAAGSVLPEARRRPRRGVGRAVHSVVCDPQVITRESARVDAVAREIGDEGVDHRDPAGRRLNGVEESLGAKRDVGRRRGPGAAGISEALRIAVGALDVERGRQVSRLERAHLREEEIRLRRAVEGRIEEVIRPARHSGGLRARPVVGKGRGAERLALRRLHVGESDAGGLRHRPVDVRAFGVGDIHPVNDRTGTFDRLRREWRRGSRSVRQPLCAGRSGVRTRLWSVVSSAGDCRATSSDYSTRPGDCATRPNTATDPCTAATASGCANADHGVRRADLSTPGWLV